MNKNFLDKLSEAVAVVIFGTILFAQIYIYNDQNYRQEIILTNEQIHKENSFPAAYQNLLKNQNNIGFTCRYKINENTGMYNTFFYAKYGEYIHDNFYIKEKDNNYTLYLKEDKPYFIEYNAVFSNYKKSKEYHDNFITPEMIELTLEIEQEDFYRECLDLVYNLNSGNFEYEISEFNEYYVVNAVLDNITFFKLFNTDYIGDLPKENSNINYTFYINKETNMFETIEVCIEYLDSEDYLECIFKLKQENGIKYNTASAIPLKEYRKEQQ